MKNTFYIQICFFFILALNAYGHQPPGILTTQQSDQLSTTAVLERMGRWLLKSLGYICYMHRLIITQTCPWHILQYFTAVENGNFQMKKMIYFSYFCSKHRSWVHVRTASLTSTYDLCFRAKIRKNVYPCKPQFYYIKVGVRGSSLYGHVFLMKHLNL